MSSTGLIAQPAIISAKLVTGIDAATSLNQLDFTDIFIEETGGTFMKGLLGDIDDESPLQAVPAGVMHQLPDLHAKVCDIGQNSKEFFTDYAGLRFRVSRINAIDGITYTLRRTPFPIPRIATLSGIPPRIIQALGKIGADTSGSGGLILIAGRTGSGKTTTACSLLQEFLTHYGDIAVTVEDPVEMSLSGFYGKNRRGRCFQTQVDNGDFKGAMKDTMRRAPRYILLGEVRGGEEASQAIRAAINGHIVITTIHAGSTIQALQALLKFVSGTENMELAAGILSQGISAVVHQQLLRVPGASSRTLALEWLFFDQATTGARHAIRANKMEQLVSLIEQQRIRVQKGMMPTGN